VGSLWDVVAGKTVSFRSSQTVVRSRSKPGFCFDFVKHVLSSQDEWDPVHPVRIVD
jgi:hypothetical protein